MTCSGNTAAPLFVEHPTKSGVNIAQCLGPPGWQATVEACAAARGRIASALGGTGDFEDCIEWLLRGGGAGDAANGAADGTAGDAAPPAMPPPAKRPRLERLASEDTSAGEARSDTEACPNS